MEYQNKRGGRVKLHSLMVSTYGAPNQSIFPTLSYGLFDFLCAQLDFGLLTCSTRLFIWSTNHFIHGQLDFFYGQLITFYLVNTTFYTVMYLFYLWSTCEYFNDDHGALRPKRLCLLRKQHDCYGSRPRKRTQRTRVVLFS